MTTEGMQRVLTEHANARIHKHVTDQSAQHQHAYADLSATEVDVPTLEPTPGVGSWLTCRPKTTTTHIKQIVVSKPTHNGYVYTRLMHRTRIDRTR